MSPVQRLNILLELMRVFRKEGDASSDRLERVYSIRQLRPNPPSR
jgi:hypothetical protein